MNDTKQYDYTDKYGTEWEMIFQQGKYYTPANLYIEMVCKDPDEGYYEPYADLTVNLGEVLEGGQAFIDTNNLGNDIIVWLEENDIAHATGDELNSGFCTYPLVEFSEWFLEETPFIE